MSFLPGDRAGWLTIERELGRGAFGVVYLARDQLLGRQVALKVLPGTRPQASEEHREQILQEARIVARVQNPHVVTLYRIHETPDGGFGLEMEFVEGGSLEEALLERPTPPLAEAVRTFRGICRGLEAAHESRVFHGDIKPENLLFDGQGRVKLADFGVSRMLEGKRSSIELEGRVLGSPLYMAPEVITGEQAGIASDLWSAGVVFYQLLAGKVPFNARSLAELISKLLLDTPPPLPWKIPAGLRRIIDLCLAQATSDRPSSAKAILALLSDEIDGIEEIAVTGEVELRTNLARATTSFVGREREVAGIRAMLSEESTTMVTLTGPGGIGKTRLAQEVGWQLIELFPGGVYFADLSEATSADDIAHVAAEALDLPTSGGAEPAETVAAALENRPATLIILDNFEQVVAHGPATVGAWRRRAGHAKFLITSRALLMLRREQPFELPPLACDESAPDDADAPDYEDMAAVRLFVDRVTELSPTFEPDEDDLEQIVAIVRELDGLPLAIELAAARVRIMNPAQIARHLERRFMLLRTSSSELPERRKTLFGAIDWSFELLEDHEKAAFLQACCFREGFSVEAAEKVLDLSAWPDAPCAMDVVQSLRDKSLLVAKDVGTEVRLGFYRSIHEFGEQRRHEELGEHHQQALAERHAEFYLSLAEVWNARIPGRLAEEAFDRIALELANLDGAADWFLRQGDAPRAARTVLAAAETMKLRRPARFLIERLDRVEGVMDQLSPELRAGLLAQRTAICTESGDWDRALSSGLAAVEAGRAAGDGASLVRALRELGEILRRRADFDGALAAYSECETLARDRGLKSSLARAIDGRGMILGKVVGQAEGHECCVEAEALAREAGDGQTLALCLHNRGVIYENWGRPTEALSCYREEEDISRRLGYRLRVAASLGAQGNVHLQVGDLGPALGCYVEAERIARELGARQRLCQILSYRGALHKIQGNPDLALECYEEGQTIAQELGDQRQIAVFLGQMARAYSAREEVDRALDCYRRAEELAEQSGDRLVMARNLLNRGSLLYDLERNPEAREVLEQGLRISDEMNAGESVWCFAVTGQLADLLMSESDSAGARKLAEKGIALAATLGISADHPEEGVRDALALFEEILGSRS